MTQEGSGSPKDDYFNDLTQQVPDVADIAGSNGESSRRDSSGGPNAEQPKAKRIACILCRKRKLRCDGARPTCGTCKRLSHDCAYDEVRKKSGPKRGYVKLLEARLQQVETLLKSQDPADQSRNASSNLQQNVNASPSASSSIPSNIRPGPTPFGHPELPSMMNPETMKAMESNPADSFSNLMDTSPCQEPNSFSWDVIGLGLEEPLPTSDVINDLHQTYFEKIHPSIPMIHRPRYLSAMNLTPNLQPPICLRYMIWCLASSASEKYDSLTEIFYYRARKYAHMDEMKGHGESIINLGTCQAWLLIALYEFKNMYFPRAWLSVGRACRAAQMMMLHRLDGAGLDVKQCLPPPKDWVEREERRRTFWTAFCEDRYASIGTGWPMTIDERDIMTNLPASEDAFEKGKPEPTLSLDQAMKPGATPQISRYSGVIVMAALFGRNLHHLHRPAPDDDENNLDGAFWRRHRALEGILSHIALTLPDHLRLPGGLPDPNVIFMNMAIHTSAICLHQAAIFKADRHRLPPNVSSESRVRCVTAAAETARLMRMISHLDLVTMNPFLAFCLYVAARVFVQYLKFRPKDTQMTASLQFLLEAMHALKRKNPLTESFLVQLDVDLEGAGIDVGQRNLQFSRTVLAEIPQNSDSVKCSPLFEIRDSQSPNAEVNRFSRTTDPTKNPQPPCAATDSPGPPFHTARANMNFDMDSSQFTYLSDKQNQIRLPHHPRSPIPRGRVVTLTDSIDAITPPSDIDRSPLMSTDQGTSSHSNSSPQNTFTPPSHVTPQSQQDDQQGSSTQIPATMNKNSPISIDSPNNLPTPNFTNISVSSPGMFPPNIAMDPSFSQFQPNFMPFEDPSTNAFFGGGAMSNVWEMSGIETSAPTGMTPAPSGDLNWNQVLEGIADWTNVPEALSPGMTSFVNPGQGQQGRRTN